MLNVINYCVKEKVKITLHFKLKIISLIHFLNTIIKECMKSCNKDIVVYIYIYIFILSAKLKNLQPKIISLVIKNIW